MSSSTTVIVSFISMAEARAWQLNESMDQLYEPKENGHKSRDAAEIPNQRHDERMSLGVQETRLPLLPVQPVAVAAPSHLHLPSGCGAGRLHLWFCWPETRLSGQQTRGRFTAAALHYALSVRHVWHEHLQGTAQHASCQILTSPSNPLYSTHFITFAQWFASTFFQQFIARSLTAIPCQRKHMKTHSETTYPVQKKDKIPEGAVNLETVET